MGNNHANSRFDLAWTMIVPGFACCSIINMIQLPTGLDFGQKKTAPVRGRLLGPLLTGGLGPDHLVLAVRGANDSRGVHIRVGHENGFVGFQVRFEDVVCLHSLSVPCPQQSSRINRRDVKNNSCPSPFTSSLIHLGTER